MLNFQEVVYKLEAFKNCNEGKHIMIMIIAIIYIFIFYVIFDQQLKITFRKSSAPLKKLTQSECDTICIENREGEKRR